TEVFDIASIDNDSLLFVATKDGPFVYSEKFGDWEALMTTEIPHRNWTCVQAFENENSAWFGTFGRGLWEFNYQFIQDTVSAINETGRPTNAIRLHPNPTSGHLKIDTKVEIEAISVHAIDGKKVASIAKSANDEVNIKNLKSGVYFIRLQLITGEISHHKIVKE
ncbi:T9SS type A sorting domain-containing protein, partial [bacterium]|nr:T9SS type A sorting domain-containing protein [bacterium]